MVQRLKRLPPTQETRVQSLGREDPLEKEMATHSSILAWRIPWTEKPSRLQSTGSQRVGHAWATSPHLTVPVTLARGLLSHSSSICLDYADSSGLPQWLSSKESACYAGDMGSVPPGRSPGGGHGNPLQDSCLENPMDKGAWWSTVHGVTKSQAQLKWLSTLTDGKTPNSVINYPRGSQPLGSEAWPSEADPT